MGGLDVRYVAPMQVRKKGSLKTYYSQPQLIALMLRATFALLLGALQWRADILQVCKPHPMNGIAGVLAHFFQRNQLFVDCDDFEPGTNRYSGGWQHRVVQFFERWVSRQADWVTTNTRFTQKRLEQFGIPPARILYIPNGMDRSRFSPPSAALLAGLRRDLQLEGVPVVLYLGTLSRNSHNLTLLLQAFCLVREEIPTAVQLGLHPSVRFTGRIPADQVVNYYALGSVAVDPVLDDEVARGRSPLKMMEAFACGIPFVTADVGDRRSLAGQPPAALLASTADRAGLAQAILSVLGDSALAQELSRRGLERSLSFEWKVLARELESAHLAALRSR